MHTEGHTRTARGVFTGEVVANRAICRGHYRLQVLVERFPPTQPGQFVQVQCRPLEALAGNTVSEWPAGRPPTLTQPELRDTEAFLRRPLSLAGRTEHGDDVELSLVYRVVGVGTRWLAGLGGGEPVSVLGPLGNGFTIRGEAERAVLVGGGVGIPPLMYLAHALAAAGKKTIVFAGARTGEVLPLTLVPGARVEADGRATPCVAEFAAAGAPSVVATDDGSMGYRGFISEALSHWLEQSGAKGGQVVVYCCGPEAMMQAVAAACVSADIECQLALERHMACGMGTCQSCVVKTTADSADGWKYSLCCQDGPVFDARDVLW
ncbi:MAG: dihydroorotate dehydrogenase electron transfer subunit [Phycisphaerae bacterium]|nr:dihydroorotate dehydrogenase electron transfer subunit [Phycisphaerae bacterium]